MTASSFVARTKEKAKFQQILTDKKTNIWLIYGVGGIGKTELLKEFSATACEENQACLFLDVEQNQDTTIAELLWRNASIAGESISDTTSSTPETFIKLGKKLNQFDPVEALDSTISKGGDMSSTGLKLGLTLLQRFGFHQYKNHPEKYLLEALGKDCDNTPVTLLIDNHELAQKTPIKTSLKNVNTEGVAEWQSKNDFVEQDFYTWLQHIIRYLSNRVFPVHVIITGRKRFQSIHSMDLGNKVHIEKENLLTAFTQTDIQQLIERKTSESTFKEPISADLIAHIFSATSGLPLLTLELVNLILSKYEDRLHSAWEDIELDFKEDHEGSFQTFILKRLADKVEHSAINRDNIWHLALPYQYDNIEEILEVLFPQVDNPQISQVDKQQTRLDALISAGLLQRSLTRPVSYQPHQITRSTLLNFSRVIPHKATIVHQRLLEFFQAKNDSQQQLKYKEAVTFHQLCASEGERLSRLGMYPETYWHLVKGSAELNKQQRNVWLYKPLPKTDAAVVKRIQQREKEQALLVKDMSSDAQDFLHSQSLGDNNLSDALKTKEQLEKWIEQAPNLSDLHFLNSQLEPDDEKRLDYLRKIIDSINPFHPFAQFEQGVFEHLLGSKKASRTAFKQALNLGISSPRNILAKAYLNWLNGDLDTAITGFKAYLDVLTKMNDIDIRKNDLKYRTAERLRILTLIYSQLSHSVDTELSEKEEQHSPQRVLDKQEEHPVDQLLDPKKIFKNNRHEKTEASGNTSAISLSASWSQTDKHQPFFSSSPIMQFQVKKTEIKKTSPRKLNTHESNTTIDKKTVYTLTSPNTDNHCTEWNNKNSLELHELACQLEEKGNYIEAEETYRETIRLDPEFAAPWHNLGNLLTNPLERYAEAEEAYHEAIRLDSEIAASWNGLGYLFAEHLERYAEAEEAYREAIRLDPEFALPWYSFGNLLANHLERYAEAEEAYRRAIHLDPEFFASWHNLGNLLTNPLERYAEAEEAYREAIHLDSEIAAPWSGLGYLFAEHLERYAEAEEAYREAIRLNPVYAPSWYNLGNLLANYLECYDEAEKAYCEAIRLDPEYANPWYALGILYEGLEFHFEAKEAYLEAIHIDSEDPDYWHALGNLLDNYLECYDEAEKAYCEAIRLDTEYFITWHNFGDLLTNKRGQHTEAEEVYREAIRINPGSAIPWHGLGNLYTYHLELYAEAEEAYREAIRIDPEFTASWNGLGALFTDYLERLSEGKILFLHCLTLKADEWMSWNNLGINHHDQYESHEPSINNTYIDVAIAGKAMEKGNATLSQMELIANKVWLAYHHWSELLACAQYILDQDPEHAKALGFAAYASEKMNDYSATHDFADKALAIDPFELHATLAKTYALLAQEKQTEGLSLLHKLYNSTSQKRSYQNEMVFMELFERFEDTNYVWQAHSNAYLRAEKEDTWIPKYQLAKYYWHTKKQIKKSLEIIDKIKRITLPSKSHAAVDLLEAEVCFVIGDLERCKKLLQNVKKITELPDDPIERIMVETLTEEENLQFQQLLKNFQTVTNAIEASLHSELIFKN